ncbi:MAG: hypothetical protein OQJ89_15280 [Kangiellaceae bacterium]|nr:hypothetical protein [Kangiellaceae bacterium]MCW8997973.1 hypothetical protein [Kangiellaceae bacterium]MCW9018333.1 hypothetical protein [Kangiellaceae bacterium]
MTGLKTSIRAVVVSICKEQGIAKENIEFGYEYAEALSDKGHSFSYCINEGVEVAKGQQIRANSPRPILFAA